MNLTTLTIKTAIVFVAIIVGPLPFSAYLFLRFTPSKKTIPNCQNFPCDCKLDSDFNGNPTIIRNLWDTANTLCFDRRADSVLCWDIPALLWIS